MDKQPKRRRYYTFMVIPHDSAGAPYSLKVPLFMVRTMVALVLASVLVVGSSVVYTSLLSRRLVNYYRTIAKNREQQRVIENFSRETKKVHAEISELIDRDNELRQALGLKSWTSKIKLARKLEQPVAQVAEDLKAAELQLAEKKVSFGELKQWVAEVQSRFAVTPSRWPLHGGIVSAFGYRVYPWRGMHYGVDIQARYGAPIRATADGVVAYAGWRRGYGKTIELNHGYGKGTLYAHCSRFAVNQGQKISKGQVIAYVGTTGYSTGPHLHYEVRNAGRPVNPVAYLNLNLLTASRAWRN